MNANAVAFARAVMNALIDELEEQGFDDAGVQNALLSVIGIGASLAVINGVTYQEIGDEALSGVLHGRQLLAGRSTGQS
jgi:hypothetical protein